MSTVDQQRIIGSGASHPAGAPGRTTLASRTLFWALLAICAALLVATLSEAWVRHGVEVQVEQTQAQNAALQRDTTATRQAIATAESPAAIEAKARAWGYIRPGDVPVIVVTPTPTNN